MTEEQKPTTEQLTEPQQPQEPKEPVKQVEPFKSFLTQEDFDNETAKIRGNAERKAKTEFLKQLGIDSEDKLEAIKKAYENSLTEQDRISEQLKQLGNLQSELAESKAIISALSKTSNKSTDEITKLVKMAKGLVSDDYTIEQALDEVISMIQVQVPQKSQIPSSNVVVTTPDNSGVVINNPFKDGNMTEMGKLIKENPEEARKLARLANYPINW